MHSAYARLHHNLREFHRLESQFCTDVLDKKLLGFVNCLLYFLVLCYGFFVVLGGRVSVYEAFPVIHVYS